MNKLNVPQLCCISRCCFCHNVMKRNMPLIFKYVKYSTLKYKEMVRLKERLLKESQGRKSDHVYHNLYPLKSKNRFCQYMKETELYNKNNIIAINKPYGVPKILQSSDSETVAPIGSKDLSYCVNDVADYFKSIYKLQHMEPAVTTERWTSGVYLFSSSTAMKTRIDKSKLHAKSHGTPHMIYWAVTVGIPSPTVAVQKVGIHLEEIDTNNRAPVIKTTYSKSSVKAGDVKPVNVEHRVLAMNTKLKTSLVEVCVSITRWNFIKVWLAHCCSPVLGDLIYGGRVRQVFDKSFRVSPFNKSFYEPPTISKELLSKLSLGNYIPSVGEIPCHLHMVQVRLPFLGENKTTLSISASVPPYFLWTCERLGLTLPNAEYHKNI